MINEHSFHGLVGRYNDQGQLLFKDRNFTSNDYYSNTYMMSHFPKYWYFVTIGSRGRGKTYSGKNFAISWILSQMMNVMESNENGQIRKFMWWRLTEGAIEKVIENNGSTFFEKTLLEKHNIKIMITNQDIFFARLDDFVLNDDDEKEYHWTHVGKIASIQKYYEYKGNQLNEYDTIIMDELVRAESERRTFHIPKAFINSIENVCRKRKGIRVLIYANAIGEMHEVKELFGFMPLPGRFGVYKIFHKRTIIEYLDDSEQWKQEQASTMAGILQSSSEFTNVHVDAMEDKEDFFIQRKDTAGKRYFASLKIDRGLWLDIHTYKGFYYIDTDNYTSKKMQKQNRYALDQTLVTAKTIYSKEIIKFIQEIWNVGQFRFSSRICFDWFTKALEKYNLI